MKSKHDDSVRDEHRIVVDMTALEATLFLRHQPVVVLEVRKRVRVALSGCDHAAKTDSA